ncbi:MAG: glycerol transport system ATP-binding protein [Pseudohongiellaceae bacterium]|jgi:glycerol transport system ATP-binding protein
MLELINVSRQIDGEVFVDDISLTLERGTINILLGPTLAGKTSLMRLMAGLDKPDSGEIRFDGEPTIGVPVQKRNIAMVYQQFINYPNLSVFENIASPLRVAKTSATEIAARVAEVADLLRLGDYLNRLPAELSGGQQQRVALARAIIKRAGLVLLDEPLANLDYKLREELRSELPALFAELGAVLVYATTEPAEALILGGKTACLHQGRLQQFSPTLELFRQPNTLQATKTFSDPPLNCIDLKKTQDQLSLLVSPSEMLCQDSVLAQGNYTLGVRPYQLRQTRVSENDLEFAGSVTVTELSGSESFIHFDCHSQAWVALLHGIHGFKAGDSVRFYVDRQDCFMFDQAGALV